MEEVQTGVESASAAEVQETEVSETQETVDTTETQDNSGVESSEVAAQTDEKGFAKALKVREEQIRAQLEKEYAEKNDPNKNPIVERLTKFYGYESADELAQELERAEQDRMIKAEAEKLGVDEEVIRNHLQPLNQKLQEYENKMKTFEQQELERKVQHEVMQLAEKHPDFEQYKDQVFDIAIQKGYSLEDAYKIATYEDRLNAVKTETQQETLRKLQENGDSSPGALGQGGDEKISFSSLSKEEQRKLIADVKAGNRRSL